MRVVGAALLRLVLVLNVATWPLSAAAQQATAPAATTVLFVCEHGTVKSLLAKVLFEQYAREVGLAAQAVSRGTKVDSAVPPWMLSGLGADGVSLGSWRPQPLLASDLASASYVVSFDVPEAATAAAKAPRMQWDGLPSVSLNYAAGRDAIRARIHLFIDSLTRARRGRQQPSAQRLRGFLNGTVP